VFPPVRGYRGITIVELLFVIAILGILTAATLPVWEQPLAKIALRSNYNLFMGHLLLARSEAIKRETIVTLCPSADGRQCLEDHHAWGKGYLLFANPTSKDQPTDSTQIIAAHHSDNSRITIATSSHLRNRITFLPSGRSWFSNTTITVCHDDRLTAGRAIVISGNGRIRKASTPIDPCP